MKPNINKNLYFSEKTVILIKKIIPSENLKERFRKTDNERKTTVYKSLNYHKRKNKHSFKKIMFIFYTL
jgi:hypothetical protein